MNTVLMGSLIGLAAVPAWMVVNLLIDFLFLPVIRRHSDQLNEVLLANPLKNLLILAVDLAFWGAVFGGGYGLLYSGLQRFGPGGGILWGFLMFVSFSRGSIESNIWTKIPNDMNLFFFVEGLGGLVAWGAALGLIFYKFIWIYELAYRYPD